MTSIFHRLTSCLEPPKRMPNPFCYTPHPLCRQAMDETISMLRHLEMSQPELAEELAKGKMMGVLVASDADGHIGYLSAFSGQIADNDTLPGFVPPVFRYLHPDGYFKREEARITAINNEISLMENGRDLLFALGRLAEAQRKARRRIDDYRLLMAEAKSRRDAKRGCGDCDEAAMIRESQFMKAELRRIKASCKQDVAGVECRVEEIKGKILAKRKLRQQLSDSLQRWLFGQFRMLNANGESRSLTDIFEHTPVGVPPSGSGECCEPRLLQYAFANGLKPLCMAMMWVGKSPRQLVRMDRHYYPACQGRCKPILDWMLRGLDVEENPAESETAKNALRVMYADSDIVVVGKPAGMLSVPGKNGRASVKSVVEEMFPHHEGPMIVHRLDMATSGIMVVALTTEAYLGLQRQFASRTIRKRYVALLQDVPGSIRKGQRGIISLPLSPDHMHRPCQMVDKEHGKEAITEWEMGNDGMIFLYPHTGRTHQLRVHCAHAEGLATPIRGDMLYGTPAERLYLHAESIDFLHPITGKALHFCWNAEPWL